MKTLLVLAAVVLGSSMVFANAAPHHRKHHRKHHMVHHVVVHHHTVVHHH